MAALPCFFLFRIFFVLITFVLKDRKLKTLTTFKADTHDQKRRVYAQKTSSWFPIPMSMSAKPFLRSNASAFGFDLAIAWLGTGYQRIQ
jgi:hypothetical protein